MSESKHTPGPWEIKEVGYPKDKELWICKFQDVIAKISRTKIDEQAEANARLIVAAPETKEQRDELLEAAQFALDAFGQSYSQESEAKARLRAIIAKCEKG